MLNHPGSPRQGKISHDDFDPFNDRLSRDIRNTLSEAFVDSLAEMAPTGYQTVAAKWLAGKPASGYIKYIQDRLHRYDRVLAQTTVNRLTDALLQSLVIWNNGLFFEFHDHLERIWQKTTGDEHQALKGLINAAGIYIHMEHNHEKAVESLSTKSFNLMRRYSHCLTFITNLDVLTESIKNLNAVSPKLENPALGVIWNRPGKM
jgi:hypothetical protein